MTKRVVILGHPGALGMEILAARDLLQMANWCARELGAAEPFAVEFATLDGSPIPLWGGGELGPARRLSASRGPLETLIVIGGPVAEDAADLPALGRAVGAVAARSRRVAGICTGAFILGAAGLLAERHCTTHWMWGDELARRHPSATVDTRQVFIADGPVWTSGAVSTGLDLILALIDDSAGAHIARAVAQRTALFLRHTGGQHQYAAPAAPPLAARSAIRLTQETIIANPGRDHSLTALAERAHMSPRNFMRVFRAEVGMSPRAYVEQVRLSSARQALESGHGTVEGAAANAGFPNYQAMRRVFVSELGVTPSQYRDRFGAVAAAHAPRQQTG